MKARKIALRFGFGMIVLSGSGYSAPELEAELDSSGGTTTGGWVCGPAVRVNYAGMHGQVQVAQRRRDDPDGPGYVGQVAGSAESQNIQLIEDRCDRDCAPERSDLPPDRVMWAGNVRLGYRSEDIGVLLGATAFQGWERNTDDEPALAFCPDIEFSLGPRKSWFLTTGFGSGFPTLLHRPGLYFGGGVGTKDGYRLELFTGVYRQGPTIPNWLSGNNGKRVNLTGWVPLSPDVDLRLGASKDLEGKYAGGEGSVGARFYF